MPNSAKPQYGLEQARIKLPALVAQANAGVASVITRHGKPYAAIVSIEDLQKSSAAGAMAASVTSLRGTGKGLWVAAPAQTVAELRDEWGDV
jgi:prevent-host-death family protein